MNNKISAFFVFSLLSASPCAAYYYTTTKTYYYRDMFSLDLVKNGVNSFLSIIKKTGPITYTNTLNDVIDDAPLNNINVPHLLKKLTAALTKKINRIERVQGKDVDYIDLVYGSGLLGVSAAIIGGIYYVYKKYHVDNNKRFDELKKSLESKGFGVMIVGESITIVTPSPAPLLSVEDMKESQEIFDVYQKRKNFGALVIFGGLTTLCSTIFGILRLKDGFYPHYDDAYLENYKAFLLITKCKRLLNG